METPPPDVRSRVDSYSSVWMPTTLDRLYFPRRGLVSSFCMHGLALTALALFPSLRGPENPWRPWEVGSPGDGGDVQMVMFLPPIGGGGGGGGKRQKDGTDDSGGKATEDPGGAGGESSADPGAGSGNEPDATPSVVEDGLVHPGPQVVRSAFPNPTSKAQTLLQPELEDLPALERRLDLPNLLAMPELGVLARSEPKSQSSEETFVEPPPVEAPQLPKPRIDELPLQSRSEVRNPLSMPEVSALPEPEPVETKFPEPREIEDLSVVKRRVELTTLLPTPDVQPLPPAPADDLELVLPDTVDPRQAELLEPEEEVVAEPIEERELEDLSLLKRTLTLAANLVRTPELKLQEETPQEEIPTPAVEPEPVLPEPPREVEELPVKREKVNLENQLAAAELELPRAPEPQTVEEEKAPDPAVQMARAELKNLPFFRRSLNLPKSDLPNILSLTPLPSGGPVPDEIPAVEALGNFSSAPNADPQGTGTQAGSLAGGGKGDLATGLTGDDAAVGNLASVVNISVGSGGGALIESVSMGGGTGSGFGTGSGSGNGSGTGPGSGSGSGSGAGAGTGPGSGAGTGLGGGPFAGISIVGGIGGDGNGSGSGFGSGRDGGFGVTTGSGAGTAAEGVLSGITVVGGMDGLDGASVYTSSTQSPILLPVPDDYAKLSVVSTENSGGGLPFVGAFPDEQIRTVYLGMRRGEDDGGPLWALEFAVPRDIATLTDRTDESEQGEIGFLLPVPEVKKIPLLPERLVLEHHGKMVIVFAVINVDGKMEQMLVKETPDQRLNRPVLLALRQWVFQPGLLNGVPVAVKVLLGIPLWSPDFAG